MPYGVNMADFILDVASGAVMAGKLEAQQARRHLITCSERCNSATNLQLLQTMPHILQICVGISNAQ